MGRLFYLQDKRCYVGNDILFWAKNGAGYVTDVSKAHIYTQEEAFKQHRSRETDIPWPKDYIDAKTRPAVDMQYVKIDEALKDVDEKLIKPKPYRKPTYRCHHCGIFMTERQYYGDCHKCGESNMP
jgi:lipopolysaccharide biosynthesis regulator YciM